MYGLAGELCQHSHFCAGERHLRDQDKGKVVRVFGFPRVDFSLLKLNGINCKGCYDAYLKISMTLIKNPGFRAL